MKTLSIVCFLIAFNVDVAFAQQPGTLKIFYHDTVTVKHRDSYRELTHIGDDSYFSKPERLDVVLTIGSKPVPTRANIQIIIEELYQPTALSNNQKNGLKTKTWVPHEVVYSCNAGMIKNGKIIVKGIDYQTAYFFDNMLYTKDGFRLVAAIYDEVSKKMVRVESKSFYFE
jgi:hypothetical protein